MSESKLARETPKAGRKRTGSVWCSDKSAGHKHTVRCTFFVQATLRDGTRSKQAEMPAGTTEARARDFALMLAERGERIQSATPPSKGDTLAEWSSKWWASREAKGLSIASDVGRFRRWVLAPNLGAQSIASITTNDVEDLVHRLDQAVTRGDLAWKSAVNVWGLVTKAFDDAHRAKDRSLRVLTENPSKDVRGPDRGAEKAKAGLYPDQLLAVLSCEAVPLQHRRAIALAVYLYARPSELDALDWSDVDVEHGFVTIHRGKRGATKTGTSRKVPIEPTLLPLLEALRPEPATGQVFPLPDDGHLTRWLQLALEKAGLEKALTETSATRRRLRFYDLRAVGVTWRLVRKDAPFDVMTAAGRDRFETTQKYIREADVLRSGFGDVFPALPASLLSESNRWPGNAENGATTRNDCGGAGNRTRVREASTASSFTCVVAVSPATESTDSAVTYSSLSRPRYRGHPHAIQPS